jgi:hypothetical protein
MFPVALWRDRLTQYSKESRWTMNSLGERFSNDH